MASNLALCASSAANHTEAEEGLGPREGGKGWEVRGKGECFWKQLLGDETERGRWDGAEDCAAPAKNSNTKENRFGLTKRTLSCGRVSCEMRASWDVEGLWEIVVESNWQIEGEIGAGRGVGGEGSGCQQVRCRHWRLGRFWVHEPVSTQCTTGVEMVCVRLAQAAPVLGGADSNGQRSKNRPNQALSQGRIEGRSARSGPDSGCSVWCLVD